MADDQNLLNQDQEEADVDNQVGEESISGANPGPESDDDLIENAHDMGLYLGDDGTNPKELNIANEVEKAEKIHQDK